MTITEDSILTKIIGPSLRDLVERRDFASIQRMFLYLMIAETAAGIAMGVTLVRTGLVS